MAHLFSPLTLGGRELPNRIAMSLARSGFSIGGGFVSEEMCEYYARRARGGVGLIISEPFLVCSPAERQGGHLGAYADAFVPALHRLTDAVHVHGASFLLTLDAPPDHDASSAPVVRALREAFLQAAWRSLSAGCDGIVLNAAPGSALHTLISPRMQVLAERRDNGLRLAIEIVETTRRWLGKRFIVGVRLPAEELTTGGLTLQDTRVLAKRLVAAGVTLIDATVEADESLAIARFPGWCVPLANGIKRVLPDVPIACAGDLGEPLLADSVVRDSSIDLVLLDQHLHLNPDWVQHAYAILYPKGA
ncbi:NADH:flavin oxidoreductase [Candidatus Gracilibacteria bacterium]|nr:NADH:flavin oxidoreductase [Candidatus Gracilibacteria bacterium]